MNAQLRIRTAGAATGASLTFYAGRGFPRYSAGQGSQAGIRSGRPRLRLSALYRARDISTTDALLSLEKFGHRNPQRVGDSGDIAERGISQAEFNAPGYVR